MSGMTRKTQEISGLAPDGIPFAELLEAQEPAVLKGVAQDWPLARLGRQSPEETAGYLKSFDSGKPVVGYVAPPEVKGRFFYNEDLTGLNFEAGRTPMDAFLDRMLAHIGDDEAPSFYIGSTDVDVYLPGLRQENDLVLNDPMFERNPPIVNIWIGTRTVASAHYDMSNNIACCMAGRRRFTLFPPDQIANIYPGPLEPTPGGQVVSMVDVNAPDFDRYPRFKEALAAAEVAEMEPGDALFYPAMWWHHVEALDAFNVMINYWWNTSPAFMDTPQNTLLHGLLSLRDRPEAEKCAWRALFDYYVFGPAGEAGAHLPEHARGALGPMDEMKARRLRAYLLNRLNR
ncbi:cupin-like domain-containing protein [Hyphococcus luteus]|uniref:Cupin n=1 Tax=Hyphococcus luteus TaxID=2058213 RepID=A0A2S7K0Q2_9PROT|nr:cupin-like domain-containing protein [Marinicaulis flavus]PQA86087.1 cupin [Marinicaulis flavus]